MVIELAAAPSGVQRALALDSSSTIRVASCDIRHTGSMTLQAPEPATKDKTGNARAKPIKRFYIDELGFYRYLDYEQKHYVCSNVSMVSLPRGSAGSSSNGASWPTPGLAENGRSSSSSSSSSNGRRKTTSTRWAPGAGEVGLEVCFKTVRHDLGISHFDKTEDYDNWKRGWDEFMRAKLISQQPVTLNRELKNRVRSGIPHDYRCKVWSALIRMRTRAIRAMFGEDIYDIIISDYVSKIGIPDYASEQQQQQQQKPRAQSGQRSQNKNGRRAQDSNNNMQKEKEEEAQIISDTKTQPPPQPAHDNSRPSHKADLSGSSYLGPMTVRADCQHHQQQQQQQQQQIQKQKQLEERASQRSLAQEPQIDKCFKQIELDLLRTLPNNRHFENPNSIGVMRVRRVLRAYACFNQEVSYCQGMNRLAAMALLVLPEEEAFWCLVAIVQCIMPRDYYLKPWLAQVDCCVLGDLLEKKLPKLHKHLVANDIQLTLFSWFFTIFVDGFRPELMLRIWDCFLLEGDKVLFRFALAILHITQDELLKMGDFSTMSSHLSRLVSTRALDVEQLFEAFNTMNPLSSGSLQARREFHMRRMRAMLEE